MLFRSDTGEDTTEDTTDGYFQDDYGNIYDSNGELIYSVDEGGQDTWEDEYGNTYDWEGNLVSEADHSDYVYTDDSGNQYDWDGNLIGRFKEEHASVCPPQIGTLKRPVG